ncbi:hypothetical protein M441DRAFT_224358 [Trichoderma asperellum CBS 433.97]|uniref:Uncharacterized protein n=1 Tax=Trichoderma asperellum (strain ATCC 204424 / CBS 433.97 / NBRC 101777) TaxID=1042311 RepID=A0A2T3ZPQ3_TRIA4|nr:hypothetical protein M441DRAFT_224358 [Trichoderma asperellum CBS 433.97]PTB46777.1 hypothetical protein M441DRAFT_224358 [Trichoderma asperellum CBS 433.97]
MLNGSIKSCVSQEGELAPEDPNSNGAANRDGRGDDNLDPLFLPSFSFSLFLCIVYLFFPNSAPLP